MTFIEAMENLLDGKKVRNKGWIPDDYHLWLGYGHRDGNQIMMCWGHTGFSSILNAYEIICGSISDYENWEFYEGNVQGFYGGEEIEVFVGAFPDIPEDAICEGCQEVTCECLV